MTGLSLDKPGELDPHRWVLINRGDKPMVVVSDRGADVVLPGFGIAVFGSGYRITNTEGRHVQFDTP